MNENTNSKFRLHKKHCTDMSAVTAGAFCTWGGCYIFHSNIDKMKVKTKTKIHKQISTLSSTPYVKY